MRVTPFSLALATPLRTARGAIHTRDGFLVAVVHDGVRGVGEATPLPGWTESYRTCGRVLEAADPAAGRDAVLVGLEDAPAARHGVALAYEDAVARAMGVSLATHLGDAPASSVPVNATLGDDDVDATVEAAEAAVEDGFECLKLKVGTGSLKRDVERVGSVRDAVGPAVRLRVDANGAWERATASTAMESLADLDVDLVEQPLPAGDLAGHAALRGRGVDVALDESLRRAGVEAVLAAEAADVVVLKPMVLGGPDRTLAAAAAARDAGVDVVVTTTVDGAVARTGAVHVAAAIPGVRHCGLATGSLLAADVAADQAPVAGGRVRVPAGPGLAGDAYRDLTASGSDGDG